MYVNFIVTCSMMSVRSHTLDVVYYLITFLNHPNYISFENHCPCLRLMSVMHSKRMEYAFLAL